MYNRPNTQSRDDGAAIVPSDATVLPSPTAYIYVGGAGDVVVTTPRGTLLTFKAVPVGTVLPIVANKVMAATTATFLVALF